MKLKERYNLDTMGNRSQELVYETIERLVEEGTALCTCEECVLDLLAWTLNHVTPRYYTSLLSPLNPDPGVERKVRVEIDLAIASGLKKLKEHPHHG
jgi:competence protein ComFB